MTWLKIPDYDYEIHDEDLVVRRLPTFIGRYNGKDRYANLAPITAHKGFYRLAKGGEAPAYSYTPEELLAVASGDSTWSEVHAQKKSWISQPKTRAEVSAHRVKQIVELYEGLREG
jgi:hypothetical protein